MSGSAPRRRRAGLDAARGVAVVAMVVFHFIWDLGHFGYIDPDFPYTPGVKAFGHAIAAAFLFIAGVSLVLAHGEGLDARAFGRRLALVAGAAALVTAGTYVAFPDSYVFFGILHCIAAASLLALPFLGASWRAPALAALASALAPLFFRYPVFDAPLLQWVGLSTVTPFTNDYRPLLPWSAALLAGVAVARARLVRAADVEPSVEWRAPRALLFLGRHSLILYLLHQPALFAAFSAVSLLVPPPAANATTEFLAACETQCVESGGVRPVCKAACECTAQQATRQSASLAGSEREREIGEIARACAESAR